MAKDKKDEIEARTEMAADAQQHADEVVSLCVYLAAEGESWNETSKLAQQLVDRIRDIRALKV